MLCFSHKFFPLTKCSFWVELFLLCIQKGGQKVYSPPDNYGHVKTSCAQVQDCFGRVTENTFKAFMHLGMQYPASCKKRVVSHITYCR